MKTRSTGLLKASAIAIALLGSTAVVGAIALPDVAYAKEGKGNGGGNGGGQGNGNGGGNGGGNGKGAGNDGGSKGVGGNTGGNGKTKGGGSGASKSKGGKAAGLGGTRSKSTGDGKFSLKNLFGGNKGKAAKKKTNTVSVARKPAKSVQVSKSVRPEVRTKGNKFASLLGVHPSELGALNAANASETALNNAAPNSRVGRIAHYRDTVLAGEDLREELAETQDLLDEMTPPDRPVSEIEEDLETAQADVEEKQDRVTELEEALADAGGTDPDIEAELEEANAELEDSVNTANDLNDERQAALDYDEAVAEFEDLAEAVDNQAQVEREALEDAANKPVTDEVEAAVKSLLGLDS